MLKITKSLKNINWKLYISLLIMGLCPTIYTTLRVFFLGSLPGDSSFSIAGQLSWVHLIYEVMDESIILPLYFFMGKALNDKKEYANRIKTGLIISLSVYLIISTIVIIFTEPLLNIMATNATIIRESTVYIRIESVANIFNILASFMLVSLVTLGKSKYVYFVTFARLLLNVIFDTFFVSTLDFSANLGVNGIGYSNIVVNIILFVISIVLVSKEGIVVISKDKLSFSWIKDFLKIGSYSGLESFIRNLAYVIMTCRMINLVNEQVHIGLLIVLFGAGYYFRFFNLENL